MSIPIIVFVFLLYFKLNKDTMDWAKAIERNSEALQAIIAALFAMLGLDGDASVERIAPRLRRAVLRVLRPAESAVRRLIVVVARGVAVKLSPSRPIPKGLKIGKGGGNRLPSFQLFDPRKYFAELSQRRRKYSKNPPRIHFFRSDGEVITWEARPPAAVRVPPPPDGLASAVRLTQRLQALKLALDDLPRQAQRLARLRLRREKVPSLKFRSPLRPGRPPGHRKTPVHEVDDVLAECHWLAWEAEKLDTS
jgi:hypothetical protein